MGVTQKLEAYKINQFYITLIKKEAKTVSLTVIDETTRIQYGDEKIDLIQIGANTLQQAFTKKFSQIQLQIKQNFEKQSLNLIIAINYPFLKKIQQVIVLPKIKIINSFVLLNRSIDFLNDKLNTLKSIQTQESSYLICSSVPEIKTYVSANYETICSVNLPKGKYLLTFSCLVKAHNQWIYLYMNNTQFWTHGGYYLTSTNQFESICIRKVYEVPSEKQTVSFQTYMANSYSVSIANAIVTARKINQRLKK